MENSKLVIITGPTAVGKTELSIQVAERLGCPIINADSRQIYKDIEIGTAAPTEEEMKRVKHYFVHSIELDEYYSAAKFEEDVLSLTGELFKCHDCVVMTGGSMMYIDAVTNGIDDIPTIDEETRSLLKHRFEEEGLEPLLAELKLLDPEYYEIVDKKNHKRVVHALEICYMTGQPYSSFRTKDKSQDENKRPFEIIKIGLRREREKLFERINKRVELMMEQGFMEEARRVYPLRHLNSLNTVGYKELFNVISGEWELGMATERIKKNTRVYAKKQMTWYKKDANMIWIDMDNKSVGELVEEVMNIIGK